MFDIKPHKPILILRLNGGLGNQMFQYAYGYSYSRETGVPVIFDQLTLTNKYFERFGGTNREFTLNVFGIKTKKLKDDWLNRAVFVNRTSLTERILGNGYTWLMGVDFNKNYKWQNRNPFKFYDDAYYPIIKPTFLYGFFQSFKYFENIQNEIPKIFKFPDLSDMSIYTNHVYRRVKSSKIAVSLHVRRGDYLKYPGTFNLCPIDYYRSCINSIEKKLPRMDISYFVFSDDQEYVRAVFDGPQYFFVDNEKSKKDYEDMFLMSQCSHNIIANSSFSWWGSWLNQNPDKLIYAPRLWMRDESFPISDYSHLNWTFL